MKNIIIIVSILFLNFFLTAQDINKMDKKIDDAFNELDKEVEDYDKERSLNDAEADLEKVTEDYEKEREKNSEYEENSKINLKGYKIIKNLEKIMKSKYSKIQLGRSYKFVKAFVSFSNFQNKSSEEKDRIFLYGYMSQNLKAKYTNYLFNEDSELTNIFFMFEKNKKNNPYTKIKQSFKKRFGNSNKIDTNTELWKGKINSLVIYKSVFIDKIEFVVVHYFDNNFFNDSTIAVKSVREYKDALDFKNGIDFSIGLGINGSFFDTKFYNFKYKYNNDENPKYDILSGNMFFSCITPITIPISFSYFYNKSNSVGFTFITSYSFLRSYTQRSFMDVSLHRLSFKLMLKNQYGKPETKTKFISEIGLKIMYDAFYDMKGNSLSFESSEGYKIYGPVSFLSAGLTFDMGAQIITKNLSLTVACFTDFTLGKSTYDYYNLDPNSFNMNISFGVDVRFNYYNFKKLK